MNRSQLIKAYADRTGLSHEEASWMVRRFFDVLSQGIRRDGRVELRGFGVFKVSIRHQAGFQNPRDGRYYGGMPLHTIRFYASSLVAKEGF